MKAEKQIAITNGLLTFFLAGCAFILSYDALRQVALAAGVNAWLAYVWPLTIDAFMAAACLTTLRASLQGERALFAQVLVFGFTALSIVLNIGHISPLLPAWAIWAIPPASFFLAVELLTSQMRGAILSGNATRSLRATQEAIAQAQAELAQLQAQADASDAQVASPVAQPRGRLDNDALLAAWRENGEASNTELAAAFGVTRQAVAQRRAALIEQNVIKQNGHGVEVLQ